MPRSFGERYFSTQPRPPRYAASGWPQLFSYVPQVRSVSCARLAAKVTSMQRPAASMQRPAAKVTSMLPLLHIA